MLIIPTMQREDALHIEGDKSGSAGCGVKEWLSTAPPLPCLPRSPSLECPGLCLWVYFLLGLAVSRGWGRKEGKKEWLCQHNSGASGPSGPDCHPLQKGQPSPRCSQDPEPQRESSFRDGVGGTCTASLSSPSLLQRVRTSELQRQMRKPSQEAGSDGPGHSSTHRRCYAVCHISPGKGQPLNTFSHFSCLALLGGEGVGEVRSEGMGTLGPPEGTE